MTRMYIDKWKPTEIDDDIRIQWLRNYRRQDILVRTGKYIRNCNIVWNFFLLLKD